MWWRKKRSFEDFKEEIESHLAIEADEIRDTARRPDSDGAARRTFGNVGAIEEKLYEHSHWMFLDHLSHDLRQAMRQIKRRPGFCAVVILTLALGIGANSAIFSIVGAVLRRPRPSKDPSRLAMVVPAVPRHQPKPCRACLPSF